MGNLSAHPDDSGAADMSSDLDDSATDNSVSDLEDMDSDPLLTLRGGPGWGRGKHGWDRSPNVLGMLGNIHDLFGVFKSSLVDGLKLEPPKVQPNIE